MDNLTSAIFNALESWKLDQARTLLERDSYLLSDSDYARSMDQLYDRLDISRLLNDLNTHVENKDYVAALQALEDIQVYGTWATTNTDYERLLQKYRDFQTEHLESMFRDWVAEIGKYLSDEGGGLNLDEVRRQLAEVDVLLKKIDLLPDRLRKDYEPQIQRKRLEYEMKLKEAQAVDDVERANKAEYFAEAQKLLAEAKAAGVPDKKLRDLQEQVEKNQKRAEGQSITFLNDPTKSDVERIEGASVSAKSAKAWRLAYNLAYHGYITLGEPDSTHLFDEALDYKKSYLEQLPKDIDRQIKVVENTFELGEYEEARQSLAWAKKFGMSPGKFDGKIDDYMDSIVIKGNPLGEVEGGADLAARIVELESRIQLGIENRRKARELYARAGMMMTSGTFSRTAEAMDSLLQALAVDERYKDAQNLLSSLAEQYAGSFNKIFEDKRARFDDSVKDGSWGRAGRYLKNIQSLQEKARGFLKNYPQRLADKKPLDAIPLDQFADDISQRKARFEQLQSREKSANEKREILQQTFNAARNNLDQSRRGAIEGLLQDWSSLTLRSMDVNRIRQQVQVFWEQDYEWLADNVRKIQEATNKGVFDGMQVLETVASELEGRGQGLSKVEQTLADYYGKLGTLKRRDDPFGSVDYYIKAEEHAKLAYNAAGAAAYHQAIEDLKAELKDKRAIIDARKALQNALKEKSYEEIEQILVELPEDLKNDIEIKRLGMQARVALARFHHDRFLEECRLILSVQPYAGEKSEFIAPKDRDFEHARDLAIKALEQYSISPDAINIRDLAIKYQAKEKENIEELDNYIKAQNYPAAADLATDLVSQKYPFIGAKLWKKCAEAQDLFRKWEFDNLDNWETAKEKAKAIIDRIDLGDDNAEAVFVQAQSLLERCKSIYWSPEDNFERVIDIYINRPRNAFNEASKKYAQIKRSIAKGEIVYAYDNIISFPSNIPTQAEKSRVLLLDHLAKLIHNLIELRDELINTKKTLLLVMGGQSKETWQNHLVEKNGVDHEEVSKSFTRLESASESAIRFENLLAEHMDTVGLLGDANLQQVSSRSGHSSLFQSVNLRILYRPEEEKYKYLTSLTAWLSRDFERIVRSYKFDQAKDDLDTFSRDLPGSLSDLSEGFKTSMRWLKEREYVYGQIEDINRKINGNLFLRPSKKTLETSMKMLESLDGATLKSDQYNMYQESESAGQYLDAAIKVTEWERKEIRALRNKIKRQSESIFSGWGRRAASSFNDTGTSPEQVSGQAESKSIHIEDTGYSYTKKETLLSSLFTAHCLSSKAMAGQSVLIQIISTSKFVGQSNDCGEVTFLITSPGFYIKDGKNKIVVPIIANAVSVDFEIRALLPGFRQVKIEPFLEQTPHAPIILNVIVSDVIKQDTPKLPNPLKPRAIPQPDVCIRAYTSPVGDNGEKIKVEYILYSPVYSLHFPGSTPAGSVTIKTSDLKRILARLEKVVSIESVDGKSQNLSSIGKELYDLLFPDVLKKYYVDISKSKIRNILILSDPSLWIPWELLKPYGNNWEHDHLGQRYNLGRWIEGWGALRQDEFPIGQVCLVGVSEYSKHYSLSEWKDLLGEGDISRLDKNLFVEWSGGIPAAMKYQTPIWGLHFEDIPDALVEKSGGMVRLDDKPLSPENVRTYALNLHTKRPLVTFGMRSQKNISAFTRMEEKWLPVFIQSGASAFVGTLWAVQPEVDQLFWRVFYQAIWNGSALGEAVNIARQRVSDAYPESIDGLSYYLIGDPMSVGYVPPLGEAFVTLECLEHDINQPLVAGKKYAFQAAIRNSPPIWYKDRLHKSTDSKWSDPKLQVIANGCSVSPSELLAFTELSPSHQVCKFEITPKEQKGTGSDNAEEEIFFNYLSGADREILKSIVIPVTITSLEVENE